MPVVTSIADLFGTELPIVQAPMAGVQGSALVIAVSRVGGLGSLPCATLSLDAIRSELAAVAASTSQPYNVNFFCHAPPVPDAEREAAWRRTLQPYYDELGVDIGGISSSAGRTPFSHDAADVLSEFKPRVVSFHFGLPAPELLQRVRSWGARVLSSATTVDEARWLEANGVDAIIAQGLEAGGHRGMFLSEDLTTQVGTLALVRQIARAVRVPVIAAGGISDAAGVAAAMALGAAGVQVGTAYLRCPEATTSALHRAALASAAARHTAVTNVFTGRPARGIVNRIIREIARSTPRRRSSRSPPRPSCRCGRRQRRVEAPTSRRCGPVRTRTGAKTCRPPISHAICRLRRCCRARRGLKKVVSRRAQGDEAMPRSCPPVWRRRPPPTKISYRCPITSSRRS